MREERKLRDRRAYRESERWSLGRMDSWISSGSRFRCRLRRTAIRWSRQTQRETSEAITRIERKRMKPMRKARISWSPELLSRITRSFPSQDCTASNSEERDSKQPLLLQTRNEDEVLDEDDGGLEEKEQAGPACSCRLISCCVWDPGSSISGSRLTRCHTEATEQCLLFTAKGTSESSLRSRVIA